MLAGRLSTIAPTTASPQSDATAATANAFVNGTANPTSGTADAYRRPSSPRGTSDGSAAIMTQLPLHRVIEQQRQRIWELIEERDAARDTLTVVQRELEAMKRQGDEANEEVVSQGRLLESLQAQHTATLTTLRDAEEEKNVLEAQAQRFEEEWVRRSQYLNEQLAELSKEKEELEQQRGDFIRENGEARREVTHLQDTLREMSLQHAAALQEKSNEMERRLHAALLEKDEQMYMRKTELRRESQTLRHEMQQLSSLQAFVNDDKETLLWRLREADTVITQKEQLRGELERTVATLRQEVRDAEQHAAEAHRRNGQRMQEMEQAYNFQLSQQQQRVARLRSELDAASHEMREVQRNADDIVSAQATKAQEAEAKQTKVEEELRLELRKTRLSLDEAIERATRAEVALHRCKRDAEDAARNAAAQQEEVTKWQRNSTQLNQRVAALEGSTEVLQVQYREKEREAELLRCTLERAAWLREVEGGQQGTAAVLRGAPRLEEAALPLEWRQRQPPLRRGSAVSFTPLPPSEEPEDTASPLSAEAAALNSPRRPPTASTKSVARIESIDRTAMRTPVAPRAVGTHDGGLAPPMESDLQPFSTPTIPSVVLLKPRGQIPTAKSVTPRRRDAAVAPSSTTRSSSAHEDLSRHSDHRYYLGAGGYRRSDASRNGALQLNHEESEVYFDAPRSRNGNGVKEPHGWGSGTSNAASHLADPHTTFSSSLLRTLAETSPVAAPRATTAATLHRLDTPQHSFPAPVATAPPFTTLSDVDLEQYLYNTIAKVLREQQASTGEHRRLRRSASPSVSSYTSTAHAGTATSPTSSYLYNAAGCISPIGVEAGAAALKRASPPPPSNTTAAAVTGGVAPLGDTAKPSPNAAPVDPLLDVLRRYSATSRHRAEDDLSSTLEKLARRQTHLLQSVAQRSPLIQQSSGAARDRMGAETRAAQIAAHSTSSLDYHTSTEVESMLPPRHLSFSVATLTDEDDATSEEQNHRKGRQLTHPTSRQVAPDTTTSGVPDGNGQTKFSRVTVRQDSTKFLTPSNRTPTQRRERRRRASGAAGDTETTARGAKDEARYSHSSASLSTSSSSSSSVSSTRALSSLNRLEKRFSTPFNKT